MRVGMERRVAFNVLDTNDSYCHYNHSCRHYPYVIVVAIMLPCGAASSSTMVGSKSSLCTTDCTLQVMACTGEAHYFLPVKSPICDLNLRYSVYRREIFVSRHFSSRLVGEIKIKNENAIFFLVFVGPIEPTLGIESMSSITEVSPPNQRRVVF